MVLGPFYFKLLWKVLVWRFWMLEQPVLYYIVCLAVQVFVTSDLGVAACTLWGSCAMAQAPVLWRNWMQWCIVGVQGKWGVAGNKLPPFSHSMYNVHVRSNSKSPGCPLVPLQAGRAEVETALHYADAPGCPRGWRMLNHLSPPSTRCFGEPGKPCKTGLPVTLRQVVLSHRQ